MPNPKVNQESQRALVAFLRARVTDPGQQVIVDSLADTLDVQAQWNDTPADRARREAFELSCKGLATHWKDDDQFRPEWTPPALRPAS